MSDSPSRPLHDDFRIVLTNDDGIEAPGLRALEDACAERGSILVAAPSQEQSGVGHQVTPRAPIRVQFIHEKRLRVDGTPADCARLALSQFAPKSQWVLAGINRGGNLGMDLYMSGTVAAAREAAAMGYKAIAISQYIHPRVTLDWELTSQRAARVIDHLMSTEIKEGEYWNVNLPSVESRDIDLPLVFCPPDSHHLDVRFSQEGEEYSFAGNYHQRPRKSGTDVDVCFSGQISLTRLSLNTPPAEAS